MSPATRLRAALRRLAAVVRDEPRLEEIFAGSIHLGHALDAHLMAGCDPGPKTIEFIDRFDELADLAADAAGIPRPPPAAISLPN